MSSPAWVLTAGARVCPTKAGLNSGTLGGAVSSGAPSAPGSGRGEVCSPLWPHILVALRSARGSHILFELERSKRHASSGDEFVVGKHQLGPGLRIVGHLGAFELLRDTNDS